MRLIISTLILLGFGFIQPAMALDRITLDFGDIFLGTEKEYHEFRYTFARFGYDNVIPRWWIRKWEKDVDQLVSAEDLKKYPPRGMNTISGYQVNVTSNPPAETSHLELYPPRDHFWMESGRYLRGYLVNQTEEGHQHLVVEISYYDKDGKVIFRHRTEVFNVFPKTMKPFIIDARFVPWRNVVKMNVTVVGGESMNTGDQEKG
ncbi:MAG: hypothetical protein GC154_05885 [bacterium]|nr:hypothetical protein [bacterium]